MKKPFLSVTKLSLLTLAGIGFASLFMAQPSLAQLNSVDRGTNQNSDPFSAPNSGDFNMLDMIHRANMGTINWNANQQKEQLDSTAADFRARQQKAFQEQQQPKKDSPEEPEKTQLR
ncbi:hypothetical protein [Nodularia sphaerocarpa]|uniref:hypothetical protein n=1 Tax=Nodularia sphaerocarpa TaxID=137816 RepID=UPI001EFB3774|nr:hypothetical protein [Nodularia sphaerocarpa]MDB9371974.1 hypothetical protein [Nodularia sphaerocarpa CS-585]MDB9379824.1 hypothetical protein [Nodularia sphaerocarpa CS-585A2]ULP74743.1 hypothetical protein BDGGKGIB_04413 [Nodularia sphaerocarpa UHCC 0038]